ncbi:MAG TPA: DUF6036 family nucleotidyltransferase [Acidobacteriota bacterium]|jgi:hypothetical protein
MRQIADADRIWRFLRAIALETQQETRFYLTGGATAVLLGWRQATIDVDVRFIPEHDLLLRAIPKLKETLQINVELAWPADFIPELPGWQDRSVFIAREGKISFYHYDLYSQALAKIERSHDQDLADVREMIRRGLIEPDETWRFFSQIEPQLYRYPSISPASFRRSVEDVIGPEKK